MKSGSACTQLEYPFLGLESLWFGDHLYVVCSGCNVIRIKSNEWETPIFMWFDTKSTFHRNLD